MADLYTLALTIDPSGMVTGANRAADATKKVGDEAVKLGDKTKQGTDKAKKEMDMLGSTASRLAGQLVGALAIGSVFTTIVRATVEAQGALAQLEAGLRSTSGASGQTVEGMVALSAELQRTSTFADDAVQASQAIMLTFANIADDTFPRATRAVADMATRLGTDLKSSAIQVGKALNDPILGVSMLGRAGVQFSISQKDMIKSLQESGDLLGAQNIVLKELEKQFGGSAAAARDTFGGALTAVKNAFGDLFEVSSSSTSGIVTALNGVTRVLEGVLANMNLVKDAVFVAFTVMAGAGLQKGITALNAYNARLIATGAVARAAALAELAHAQAGSVAAAQFQAASAVKLRALGLLGTSTRAYTMAQLQLGIAENASAAAATRLAAAQTGAAAATGVMAGATNVLSASLLRLQAVIAANPIAAITIAAGAALFALNKLAEHSLTDEEERLAKATEESNAALARGNAARALARRQEEERQVAAIAAADAAKEAAEEETKAIQARADAAHKEMMDGIRGGNERLATLRVENDIIRRTTAATAEGADAVHALNLVLAEEAIIREYGSKVMPRVLAQLIAEARARVQVEAAAEAQAAAIERNEAAMESKRAKAAEKAKQAAEDAAQDLKNITENLTRGMQDAFSDFFRTAMTDGLRSFEALFDGIKSLFLDMVAEMLAANVMKKLADKMLKVIGTPGREAAGDQAAVAATGLYASMPNLGRYAGYAGGALTGAAAGASMGPVGGALAGAAAGFAMGGGIPGAIIGGVAGIISGFISQAARAREAAAAMRAARKEFEDGVEAFADAAQRGTRSAFDNLVTDINKTAEQLADAAFNLSKGALQGERGVEMIYGRSAVRGRVASEAELSGDWRQDIEALEALLRQYGRLSRGSQQYLDALREIEAAYEANAAAAAEALAKEQQAMDEDLRVRQLVAEGRNAEAEAMRQQLIWERELQKAREQGLDTTQLEATQAAERDRIARDAAAAIADAEKAAIGDRTTSAIASALTQDTAGRVLGELVAIRIATRQTADLLLGGSGLAMLSNGGSTTGAFSGATLQFIFNSTASSADAHAFASQFAEAADRALGERAKARAMHAGRATMRRAGAPTGAS